MFVFCNHSLLAAATKSPSPVLSPETKRKTLSETEPVWKVVVLNDPVNLMSYVVMVFKRVFGYSHEQAKRHMLEVHKLGRSILWEGGREKAEMYVHTLQKWQLTAILENDA